MIILKSKLMVTLLKSRHRQRLGANPNENARKFCFTCGNGEILLQKANSGKNLGTIEVECFGDENDSFPIQ